MWRGGGGGGGGEAPPCIGVLEYNHYVIHYYCMPSCCEMHRLYISLYYVMKWTSMVIVVIGTCMYHDLPQNFFIHHIYHALV